MILFLMCCRVSFLGMLCSNTQSFQDLEFSLERYESNGLDPSNSTFVTCGQWDLVSMLPQQCLYSGKASPPQGSGMLNSLFVIHALIFPQVWQCLKCWMWAFQVSVVHIFTQGKHTLNEEKATFIGEFVKIKLTYQNTTGKYGKVCGHQQYLFVVLIVLVSCCCLDVESPHGLEVTV